MTTIKFHSKQSEVLPTFHNPNDSQCVDCMKRLEKRLSRGKNRVGFSATLSERNRQKEYLPCAGLSEKSLQSPVVRWWLPSNCSCYQRAVGF